MNTLQLYISKSARESARVAEINPSDEGRRAATDMKAAVALIDYPPSAKTVFFIVANVQGGYAIHIVRTIPPTKPNHLDATIFIAKDLDIMAEDLQEVLESVSATVLAKAVTEEDMNRLRHLFSREYDLRDKSPRIKPSRGSDYAYLSYGKDYISLAEILAEGLYRPEWSDYKAVCLLDETLSPLMTGRMTNLKLSLPMKSRDATAEHRSAIFSPYRFQCPTESLISNLNSKAPVLFSEALLTVMLCRGKSSRGLSESTVCAVLKTRLSMPVSKNGYGEREVYLQVY